MDANSLVEPEKKRKSEKEEIRLVSTVLPIFTVYSSYFYSRILMPRQFDYRRTIIAELDANSGADS